MFHPFKKIHPIRQLIMFALISGICLYSIDSATAAEPIQLRSLKGQAVEITGRFGKPCNTCEIIVDYGKGFLYAYQPVRWHEKKLVFNIKDLGKSLKVRVFVRTGSGDTGSKVYSIKPVLKPVRFPDKTQARTRKNKHYIFQARHNDPFGGKGLDQFDLSTKNPQCEATEEVFHQARIIIDKKRFGDARIEAKPTHGCLRCQPVKVRWYHEPTGLISYQLHVQRRRIEGLCAGQVRRK